MKKLQRDKIQSAKPTIKTSIKQTKNATAGNLKKYIKQKNFRFARQFITTLAVFTTSAFVALGTTACNFGNTPVQPVNPNPPIVTPENPNKPTDPEKPVDPVEPIEPVDPIKPVDPTDPEKPVDPVEPVDPIEPEKPVEPTIDYDKLTATDLTAEQRATIINNVTTALEKNIQSTIGRTGVVNKIIAMDFEDNNVNLLLDYTNNSLGNMYGFFKYEMSTEMNYKNLLTTEIAPQNANGYGEELIQISTKSNDERVENCFRKLKEDGILSYDETISSDFLGFTSTPGGTNEIGNVMSVNLVQISNSKIMNYNIGVKSDGNVDDYLAENLLNGTLNKTYLIGKNYEYNFSNYSLYNFSGLEKETNEENATAYKLMVENESIATIKNGKYYYEEQE